MLEVKNLSIAFSDSLKKRVVKNLTFSVDSGEIVALVGESGSGKSLTALSIPRLLPTGAKIIGGSVHLAGEDLFRYTNSEISRVRGSKIGVIFQEAQSSLNPVISIKKQISEAFSPNVLLTEADIRTNVITSLKNVGINEAEVMLDRYPHEFSGGMKQRVMIAIALAKNPQLLIADEPTTALDVTVQAQILRLIKSLQEKNDMSVLFITHDLAVAYQIADRVLVMREGEIIESGNVDILREGPSHPYSRKLLDSLPGWKKREGEARTSDSKVNSKVLDVKDLKVWFPIKKGLFRKTVGHIKAVNGVSLELKKGKTLALVGESGCGKTTTGKAIIQLLKNTEGSIFYKGKRLEEYRGEAAKNLRSEIQIVFQDPFSSMNPRMRIGEIISEGMEVQKICGSRSERHRRVEELLTLVGLEAEHFYRYPHEFSGGQRQRICIARALSVNPSILVCDEPTSSLDVSIQHQILSLLMQLQKERGMSYLFVTHDIGVVAYMADEVAVMKDGVIVESGSVHEVLKSPKMFYTKQLLDAVPVIHSS